MRCAKLHGPLYHIGSISILKMAMLFGCLNALNALDPGQLVSASGSTMWSKTSRVPDRVQARIW